MLMTSYNQWFDIFNGHINDPSVILESLHEENPSLHANKKARCH